MSFAQEIKALRTELGWTQLELAQWLGMTSGTVHEWEAGKNVPTSQIVLRAIAALQKKIS